MRQKKCKKCLQDIPYGASVCYHCNSHQSLWGSIPKILEATSLIISIGLLVLAYMQYYETKQDRIESDEALRISKNYEEQTKVILKQVSSLQTIANNYRIDAKQTLQKVNHLKTNLDSLANGINKITLVSLQNQWIVANNSLMTMNTKSPVVKKFEGNANKLLKLILKDPKLIEEWSKETNLLFKSQ